MKAEDFQRQIQSIQNTLKRARDSLLIASNNPAVMEWELILMRKREELEAVESEERTALCERIFFAEDDGNFEEEARQSAI